MEALYSSSEREEASGIPNPPSLAGSASNFLIESFGGGYIQFWELLHSVLHSI